MDEPVLIYVAGNPDAYPLEYYDQDSESYQGAIPQLLAQFSAQGTYQLVYYSPSVSDQRAHLARNLQVDLLSGYTEEELPAGCQAIPLFQAHCQGETVTYCLGLTRAAPEGLARQLETFFAAVPQQTVTGLLVEASAQSIPPSAPLSLTVGLGVALALLAALTLLLVLRFRRRLRRATQALERDQLTGVGNLDHLRRRYTQLVHEKNRILYHLIYFYVEAGPPHPAAGREPGQLLRSCAQVLQARVAKTDALARVSDNSFAMLKCTWDNQQLGPWLSVVLQELYACLQNRRSGEVHISAGAYPLQMGARDLEEMLLYAGREAHAARSRRQEWSIFSPDTLRQMELEQKLRATVAQALKRREFHLYIQFYVDARRHRIVGGEALSRWLHPELGLLSPGIFVPVLEREGLTYQLDYHCLQNCCALLQELCQAGIQDFFLSCNFSRETFSAHDFVARCREIIEDYRFPRELLIFELTESIQPDDLSPIRTNMLALKEYGIRIALDDFGEGFTSFADLQAYPVDGIKLDKRLIDNVLTETGRSILRAMIQVGHEMGLTILAEGVETQDQAQALQELDCDVIQGFQFYAPIPEAEAKDRLFQQAPSD